MNLTRLAAFAKRIVGQKGYEMLRPKFLKLAYWVHRNNLPELASLHGTDKWGSHFYAQHYQAHLQRFRTRCINLLEIGVGGYDDPRAGGQSLRMWKAFFPKANIFAVDIHDKSALEEDRIRIFRGSQDDREFLERVVQQIGRLDVIIDDGSHVNSHVLTSFNVLFPKLADDGIYVIEDLQTAYWPDFGGSEDPRDDRTSIALCKRLVDGLNWEEFSERQPSEFDRQIVSLCFYHNLVFIQKGRNAEGSNRGRVNDRKATGETAEK